MSNANGYSEAETLKLLEKCRELYKQDKIIWSHKFWMAIANDARMAVGSRNWVSLKNHIVTIFLQNPAKWSEYFPNAPTYALKLFVQSATPIPATPIPVAVCEPEQERNVDWSFEEGQKILLAMINIKDADVDLMKAPFWKSVLTLSGVENRSWEAAKAHFFTTLAKLSSHYLNDEEEMKLVERMASANYGHENPEGASSTEPKKARLSDGLYGRSEREKDKDRFYESIMKNKDNEVLRIRKPKVEHNPNIQIPADKSNKVGVTKVVQPENLVLKPQRQNASRVSMKPSSSAQSLPKSTAESIIVPAPVSDTDCQIVSSVVPPSTDQGKKLLHSMMETYANLEMLDQSQTNSINASQAVLLKYYQSIVRSLGLAAEIQLKLLDDGDAAKTVLRTRLEMDEFPYYHYLAATLVQEEREVLKALGGGIMRASVLAKHRLRDMRIVRECDNCRSKLGKFN